VRQLEDHKVRAAFLVAMEAARDRSRELAAAARENNQSRADVAGSTSSTRTASGSE
jgi:pyrroline-5-carboxylate reductase